MKSAKDLLDRLITEGGCIVSSNDASELEIADARMRGRMYVDKNGYGYILRLKDWLARVHKRDGYMQSTSPT